MPAAFARARARSPSLKHVLIDEVSDSVEVCIPIEKLLQRCIGRPQRQEVVPVLTCYKDYIARVRRIARESTELATLQIGADERQICFCILLVASG